MKLIITEEQFKSLIKENLGRQKAIEQYMDRYISKGTRKIGKKSRNYGNLREDWCVDGLEQISAYYYFKKGVFDNGSLSISKNLIKDIVSIFTIKKSFAIYVVEDWYEKTMIPKFESIVGESGLSFNDTDIMDSERECIPEPTKPEGITDEEMINFIDKNTAYKRQEIIDKIESGERDLEDFYLDIVDTVERKKRLGF
jgi:hypothetical protein